MRARVRVRVKLWVRVRLKVEGLGGGMGWGEGDCLLSSHCLVISSLALQTRTITILRGK